MSNLKAHQVEALADLYARWRNYMADLLRVLASAPSLDEGHGAILDWNIRRLQAEAAMGELWVIPCRGGKTRAALNVLLYWKEWLKEWGVPDLWIQAWNHPHLVLTENDLIRDGPFPNEWKEVCPSWVDQKLVPIPTYENGRLKAALDALRPGDIAVITYHTLLHRPGEFVGRKWSVIVADEVHRLKNDEGQWTQVAYQLDSVARLGMSATPFTNYVHELIHVLLWLQGYTIPVTSNKGLTWQRLSHIWPTPQIWEDQYCAWEYV